MVSQVVTGIIPAYAGSTRLNALGLLFVWGSSPHTRGAPAPVTRAATWDGDHPRIRGEHSSWATRG